MNEDYILMIVYVGGAVWYKGRTETTRKYPGVLGFKTPKGAHEAATRIIARARYIHSVQVIKRSYETVSTVKNDNAVKLPNINRSEAEK